VVGGGRRRDAGGVLQSNSFGRAVRADAEMGSKRLFEADIVIYVTGRELLQA
jgi:hypothetical protein